MARVTAAAPLASADPVAVSLTHARSGAYVARPAVHSVQRQQSRCAEADGDDGWRLILLPCGAVDTAALMIACSLDRQSYTGTRQCSRAVPRSLVPLAHLAIAHRASSAAHVCSSQNVQMGLVDAVKGVFGSKKQAIHIRA